MESVKARKLTHFGHVMRKKSESLEKQIMQGTTPGSHTKGRPKTTWMDNILQRTGYTLDKTLMHSEDRVKWSQLVHSVARGGTRIRGVARNLIWVGINVN